MTSTSLEPADTSASDDATVLVVDDDAALRRALGSLFRSVGLKVALYASAAELLAAPFPDTPCCLLLDVRLRGPSGLDLQARLGQLGVHIPIIFMTGYGDIAMTVAAMKAGAEDFMPKPFRDQDLLDAVAAALEKDRGRREGLRQLEALHACYRSLTPREGEVMGLAVSGLLNKQIAAEIGISEVTVKIHRGQAMRKMKARTFAELVLMAQQLGICKVGG
ncbi:response regulator transcription factor [Cupriavidus taiwanensis]|uniref:Response regulator receiver, luxR cheY family n=2 Tax=Cupriavidus taiwanensis TaxID=164546 RepID=B2AIJ1_CUPTR|nr:response regulator transcription factor [Cupriavidus taiwanensis]CAP63590.1 putative response regulator receiver, luxR cheY family [Cupriavidus taiwanensis LMG 19424]SOY71132.1 putative response regulator receiver, luxR cheY family [Cupriavidus taiwanensis]SOZ09730.1 putative response regulator receiver, luxR cheY family [Cupriavidus taiwanensis]SOZ11849.1 putative response regulator receiver, luxR cheY family [Cupriavidus taiwanensis]SOZ43204.1 putative response regulator receiver, luxR ch